LPDPLFKKTPPKGKKKREEGLGTSSLTPTKKNLTEEEEHGKEEGVGGLLLAQDRDGLIVRDKRVTGNI